MKNKYTLSIIIPIYNVEKYIIRCAESILTQINSKVEVLFIDDGSKDNSAILLQSYMNNDNVKLITKENGGVSSARNLGIQYSRGDFILFVDGDDFVSDNYVNTILISLCGFKGELICFDYFITDDNTSKKTKLFKNEIINVPDHAGFRWYLNKDNDEKIKQFCLNKVYLSSIIKENNIKFPEGQTVGEDFIFNLEYLEHVKMIKIIDSCLYHYYQRSSSVMRTYNKIYTNDIISYKERLEIISYKTKYSISKSELSRLYLKCWFGVINQESHNPDFNDAKKKIIRFCSSDALKKMKFYHDTKLNYKYKLYKLIINLRLSYLIFLVLYKVNNRK